MALSQDQKKHLFIGGGIGALAMLFGSMILGERKAIAGPRLRSGDREERPHDHHEQRRKRRGDSGDGNGRGEYGRKKKHHHKGHGHGD